MRKNRWRELLYQMFSPHPDSPLALHRFLRKYPIILRPVRSIFHALRYLAELLLGTKLREREWAVREIAKEYWSSRDYPHREYLIERLAALSPSSILEVGAASGPNLYLLAKLLPGVKLTGIDINPEAVTKGNEWFKEEGITNVTLSVGKADDLKQFQDKSFDVVFTCSTLVVVGPDKIKRVIAEMLRVARRAIVLLEWHSFNAKQSSPLGDYHLGFWKRDYMALLSQLAPKGSISIVKLPEEIWTHKGWRHEGWKDFGAIIEVVL